MSLRGPREITSLSPGLLAALLEEMTPTVFLRTSISSSLFSPYLRLLVASRNCENCPMVQFFVYVHLFPFQYICNLIEILGYKVKLINCFLGQPFRYPAQQWHVLAVQQSCLPFRGCDSLVCIDVLLDL